MNSQKIVIPQLVIIVVFARCIRCGLRVHPLVRLRVHRGSVCPLLHVPAGSNHSHDIHKGVSGLRQESGPHSAESFKVSGPTSLSASQRAMNCLGSWAYQIVYLMSGGFGTRELAANVALVNINMLSSTIHGGMSTSIATLVGNAIGARKRSTPKYTSHLH